MKSRNCRIRKPFLLTSVLVFLMVIFPATPVWAHKVNVYAYAEGKKIHARAYFSKSAPAKNAQIIVYGLDSVKVLEMKTDDEGECVFDAPFRGDLRIEVQAGEGHIGDYTLKAEELPADLPTYEQWKGLPQERTPGTKNQEPSKTDNAKLQEPNPAGVLIDRKQLEEIVESVVERKIAPIRKMLIEQQAASEQVSLERVIAGLGIIFGVMGVVMYLRSLRRDKPRNSLRG